MSDLDIDPELSALRNEILTSLPKKNIKLLSNECAKETNNEEDYELELLRREALNAKRTKTETIKKNNIPGRFRYDKESEDEEEDDEDEEINYKKTSIIDYNDDNPNNLDNEYNPYNVTTSTGSKSPEYCNYHSNYQTYRAEISKLMPNDEYDPNSIHDKQDCLPEGIDLRNFLREKALKHQQETAQKENTSSESSFLRNSADQDIVFEQPITEPINIKNELIYHRFKGKYEHNRSNRNITNSNNNKIYRSNNNHDNYDKYDRYNNNNNKNSKINDNDDEDENESDSDDDSSVNCKKLRSVVAVISNNDTYQASKDAQIVKSRSSSNNFYRRK